MRCLPCLLLLLAACPVLGGNPGVSEFLAAYRQALSNGGSVTTTFDRTETIDGREIAGTMRGLVTFHAGDDPFLRLTANQHILKDDTEATAAVLLAVRGDAVSLVDGGTQTCYRELLTRMGGHLIASRVDGDLLLLMHASLLDNLVDDPQAAVESVARRTQQRRRLSVRGPRGGFTLEVDQRTFLPLLIERYEDSGKGLYRKTIVLNNAQVSPRKPPDELFDAARNIDFPTVRWDPGNLLDKPVPGFAVKLDDGTLFDSSVQQGHRTILQFHATWSQACAGLAPLMDQIGREVLAGGDSFVSLEIWNLSPHQPGRGPVPTASGGHLVPLLNIDKMGVPCVVVIDSEGIVRDIFTGYIPDLTEAALRDAFLPGS